jgi:hypothetical protein
LLGYLFREGMSAESMVENYPALNLEQVHGALASVPCGRAAHGAVAAQKTNAELIAKLQRARHANQIPG